MQKLINKLILPVLTLVLILSGSVFAKTRVDSIDNFLDDVRINDEGFANIRGGNVDVIHTQYAIEVKSTLNLEINNTLDILLYMQSSQNVDGGFGIDKDLNSTWDGTISAVKALIALDVNSTSLNKWEIYSYLNTTANQILYDELEVGNQTVLQPKNLTMELMQHWSDYIITSFYLGTIPAIPFGMLSNQITDFQFKNGTYISLETANQAIRLGSLIGILPNDVDLASKFIRSYKLDKSGFSYQQTGKETLKATYESIEALTAIQRVQEIQDVEKLIQFILNQQFPNSGFGENGEDQPSLVATWYAIKILNNLDALIELEAPEVLRTEGFVSWPLELLLIIIVFPIIRRKQ